MNGHGTLKNGWCVEFTGCLFTRAKTPNANRQPQAAGLDVVSEVMVSQAVLICNPQSQHQELIALILKRIEGYITATQYMMISYNVTRADLVRALAVRGSSWWWWWD